MMTKAQDQVALARQSFAAVDAYTPRDMNEAMALARTFAASKILGAYGTPEQVMLVMATGAELGLPPTAALRGMYVVEGRVFLSSDLLVALCMRAPQCEQFDLTEQSETAAAYTVARKGGKPLTFRFTVEDAARAGLGQKDASNWKKYPGTMCRHRAAAIAARAVFPDVIMGLYDDGEREEMTGRQSRDGDVAPAVEPLPRMVPRREEPAAPVVEAEIVEGDEARICRLLGAATTAEAVKVLAAEAVKVWPRERPETVRAAHAEAKRRLATPAHNPQTGEVREPGADDA